MKSGHVFLVGAGPGAPGLLTVRGLECLRQADVVVYDNLCNPCLLRETPPGTEIIFAGKHSGLKTITQSRIEQFMIRRAKVGKTVVRLKGGDPFVFGRGGEEAAALKKYGIKFEIVPGITSAIAVPAYAGIPVTHRDHSSGIAIVTAYEDPDKPESKLDYETLARFPGTLIFLMGVKRLETMTQKLISCGKSSQTPVALVRWGTRGFQETLTGKLNDIARKSEQVGFRPPAVIVVGDVVRCRNQMKWFEERPLFGKRIVVTRAREQASALSAQLLAYGAEVIELPTIEIQRVQSTQLKRAAQMVSQWDWIIFASPWAADFFLDAVIEQWGDIRSLGKIQFAVIGPMTASRLKGRGLTVDLMPEIHTSEGLVRLIRKLKMEFRNKRVLLPRSEMGRDLIEKSLHQLGAQVHPLTVYRNVLPRLTWEIHALERIGVDMVTFTSSSTAENFEKLWNTPKLFSPALKKMFKKARFISIGPTTSATLRKLGMRVHAEAKVSTIEGLVQCLQKVYSPSSQAGSTILDVVEKYRKKHGPPKDDFQLPKREIGELKDFLD